MTPIREEFLLRLEAIHQQVDGLADSLAETLAERLVCRRGCSSCCIDDLTVFEVEAELIKSRCGDLLSGGQPADRGGCAFLDDQGACRIYRWRPYVCRTQGLPLRWFDDEGQAVEMRDICPLNDEAITALGENLSDLDSEKFWTIGPWEGKLATLQAEASGRFEPTRIPLRSLFLNSR